MCAVQRGKHAATFDVTHQQHRRIGMTGHPHVHDIVLRQVDLGGTSGTFDHHHIERGAQSIEGVQTMGHKCCLRP